MTEEWCAFQMKSPTQAAPADSPVTVLWLESLVGALSDGTVTSWCPPCLTAGFE